MNTPLQSLLTTALTQALVAEREGRVSDALLAYRTVLTHDPAHPGALLRVAQANLRTGQTHLAVEQLRRAIDAARQRALTAQSLPIHSELIVALRSGDAQQRLTAIRAAYADCGEIPGLIWEECECLAELGQKEARLHRLNQLAARQPNEPVILAALGLALLDSNSAPQAMRPMRAAIQLGHSDFEFAIALATIEMQNGEWGAAETRLDALRTRDPEHLGALGLRWHLAAQSCQWTVATQLESELIQRITQGGTHSALTPWRLLASQIRGTQLRDYATRYSRSESKNDRPLATGRLRQPGARIRVGYLSSDFHQHATAILMAGLFDAHDRSRFEVFAYSYGARVNDGYRERLRGSFEHWFELNSLSDSQAAALISAHEIDVLIELKGHTFGARSGIAALRPAPIQAHYLGYPGTLAQDGIDYFIADAVTAPASHTSHFVEKLVRLPHCYQANDARRARPIPRSRQSLGLPENAILLCNFNQPWKWRRDFVERWLTALSQHDQARLWLLNPGDAHPAKKAINDAAQRFGVADQLIWATNAAPDEHLARLACADLALDQLPCNSHTTAADALWMGVPLLTCVGERFDGRVTASALSAARLDDLIAESWQRYGDQLDRFLSDPHFRTSLKTRAAAAHDSLLFDTARFARDWEAMLSELVTRQETARTA